MHDLQTLLSQHKDERVIVLGGTCTGKSTFVEQIENAQDMDALLFPLLTEDETTFVCQTPWTEKIGETMVALVTERIAVVPGKPVFGTVVLNADIIIHLKISDELLSNRTASRGVLIEDAKNMQRHLEKQIANSKIPVIEFSVG